MSCPECGKEGSKVIAAGLPMKFCEGCSTLWGLWSLVYTIMIAPIEGLFNGGYSFMVYEGSYFSALWDFLFGSDK